MLSKSDYERAIASFLVELCHLCREESDEHLRTLPKLAPEIDGYLTDLAVCGSDPASALRLAFAYVDEYCWANWEQVIDASYDAYLLSDDTYNSN